MRVRGLKPQLPHKTDFQTGSHPVRVRGLKLQAFIARVWANGSHPVRVRGLKQGCTAGHLLRAGVAPRAGAWIETWYRLQNPLPVASHPVRVRGLKHLSDYQIEQRLKSHPVRVRGLGSVK